MKEWIRTHRLSAAEDLRQEPCLWKDRRLILCLVSVFAWGLLAHGYGFLHSSLSHDELNAFYATPTEYQWKQRIGRFFVPFFQELMRGDLALPWVVGMLALLFIGLSLYLMVRMLGLHDRLQIALAAGILTTNLTVTAQTASFLHELDCNFLALLFAVCAVYLWHTRRGWLSSAGACALVFLAIGIYQSYFAVAVTLMMLLCLAALYQDADVRATVLQGVRGIAILAVSIAAYGLFSAVFYKATGMARKYDLVETNGFPLFYLRLLPKTYEDFFRALFNDAYPRQFLPVLYLAGAAFVVSLIRILVQKRKEPARVVLMAALLCLLPLAMNITFLLAKGGGIHDLTYYALWFIWLMHLLAAFRPAAGSSRLRRLLCVVLIGAILWQNVLIANTAYMKKEAAEKGTYSKLTRVLNRLEQREDYVFGETVVAFIGTGGGLGDLHEYGSVSNLVGMGYNDSIAECPPNDVYDTYDAYFRYVLNYPINLCDPDTSEQLHSNPVVVGMPAFPHRDCIRVVNGILVVKLGDTPS